MGMVGPASMAENLQTFWHSSLGLHVPEGWDNQLHNEPGVVLYYEQALRLGKSRPFNGLKVDAVPHFGGALGNVYTYGAAGFTVRLGSNLDDDFGPPRIRPSLPGSGFFRPQNGLSWYLFAGMEGRAVLRNIFLDGNTFTDSHSVDKKPLVGDLQAGLVFQWSRFRFSYTQIFRPGHQPVCHFHNLPRIERGFLSYLALRGHFSQLLILHLLDPVGPPSDTDPCPC
jgi:lipid A 3-O-deacylase